MSRLETLYQQMADLTKPECANCPGLVPYSCCNADYCMIALQYAQSKGITLETTGHPDLPFMSDTGCVVPPHLRPLCTVHTCEIASLGLKRGDPDWTEKYFKLREQISELEMDLE